MTLQCTEAFIKAAKRSGYQVDLSRGVYGEWLAKRTRTLWYFWYSAWKARQQVDKKRRARQP